MMPLPRPLRRTCVALVAALALGGCLESQTRLEDAREPRYEVVASDAKHPAAGLPDARLARVSAVDPAVPVLLAGEVVSSQPASQPVSREAFADDLPDPIDAERVFDHRRKGYSERVMREYEWTDPKTNKLSGIFPAALSYIKELARPNQVRLSLEDCIRRTLANNYQIKVEGYGPAISTAQIVQAEAAFDAAFFGTASRQNSDRPTGIRGVSGVNHANIYTAGIRQRTVAGGTVSLTQTFNYSDTPGQQTRTINPIFTANLAAELRQPFMRGFGIDFNRSQIDIAKNNRDISMERFRGQAITSLSNVERFYWTLIGARRAVVIAAELLAQSQRTLEQVMARSDYDAYSTLVSNSRATFESRKADFIRVKANVLDAEDQLRLAINDPTLNLAAATEIIPTDGPSLMPTVRDQFREVEIALDRQPEIRQAQRAVEVARIQIGVAKNQALPQLDTVFRYTLNGMGAHYRGKPVAGNPDAAFDQMTGGDFADTFIALEFAWNFGERGERAAIRLAALQHSSAIASFKLAIDNTITVCKKTLRDLGTTFDQIGPSNAALQSSKDQLRSLQERAESKSPEQLNTIFNAQSQLANARQALLQAVVSYNQSITEVERAKGTLLEYDGVMLAEHP